MSATYSFLSSTTRFLGLAAWGLRRALTRVQLPSLMVKSGGRDVGEKGEGQLPSQFGPRHVSVNEGVLVGDDLESHPLYQLAKTSTGEQ
jgi:hypothetical protein